MTQVLVIGAGISGLMSAVTLAEAGCMVTLLEASERVGGRIRTVYAGEAAIELGAEFVHGKPPELLALIDDLGLSKYELGGTDISYTPTGELHPHSENEAEDSGAEGDEEKDPFSVLEQMADWSEAHLLEDLTFQQYVVQEKIDPELALAATSYVEGFNAADAREISVRSLALQQRAEDSIDGDTSFHVSGGYSRLPQALAERLQRAGGVLRLEAAVTKIAWRSGAASVQLASGEMLQAEAVVITLPLGVLQKSVVHFEPAPADILSHAARMRMGQVCRMNLVFSSRWWAEIDNPQHAALQQMGFLLPTKRVAGTHFNVFWTGYPSENTVLTAWAGGRAAGAFTDLRADEIAMIACDDLARIFHLEPDAVRARLHSHSMHDWQRDPLACGSYSWVPVGAVDASAKMAVPVASTLFFAGEHTDTTGHWGTVHGALRSGRRAAQQVLAS